MTLGKNIKTIRKERNLTQLEFAEKVGLSRSYLSDLENDRKNISTKTLELLSEKLDVSMNYLTTGEKMLRDLTEDEIGTEFIDWSKKMTNDKNEKLTSLKSIFNNLQNNDLSVIEVQFLTNSIKFFQNATSDEINFMQVLLLKLNKYYDAKYHDNYDKNEIENVYNDVINSFDNFLKKYLGINE
ncbi:helix-turn-helix transcriptional regulator [Staphylococcus sp. GDX8P102P-2]|uniref:helix-turn-helix domain-containing protein n=1 Tax=Staphylococcus sp. GDX8P102P-2 TaxID=2804106 RepID=UPI001AEBDFE2|nr:helix-turn-helix transcriptional regulator [Staphylococcus sp. GDX8P102P-2]